MSHFMMLCLLPFLLEMMPFGFVSGEERGVSVAWCKNSESTYSTSTSVDKYILLLIFLEGEWQHLLDELFSGTDVIITKV